MALRLPWTRRPMKAWRSRALVLWEAWERFFFGPVDLLPLCAFRLVFGCGVFLFYLMRELDFTFLFTERGVAPYALLARAVPQIAAPPVSLGAFAGEASSGLVLHTVFLLLLLGLALGALSRASAWLCFFLHLVFLHRNPLVVYGPDQVATCWLLYLSFARSDARLSVALPWGGRPSGAEKGSGSDPLSTVALRLAQIHLCVIYAYSGFHKIQGGSWWRGDAVWNALGNGLLVHVNLAALRYAPSAVAAGGFLVLVWEVYFPALVWVPRVRPFILGAGVLIHAFIALVMNLPFFSWFMVAAYALFLDAPILAAAARSLHKRPALGAAATSS